MTGEDSDRVGQLTCNTMREVEKQSELGAFDLCCQSAMKTTCALPLKHIPDGREHCYLLLPFPSFPAHASEPMYSTSRETYVVTVSIIITSTISIATRHFLPVISVPLALIVDCA